MINNIELIKPLLLFPDEDTFYKVEIMQRRKENPDLSSNSKLVKVYFINSIEKLETILEKEIIPICDALNARAYIYLNSRSYEKVAFAALKQMVDCMMTHDYKSAKRAYNAACGKTCNGGEFKKWLFDVDVKRQDVVDELKKQIERVGGKVYANIPTKNGLHVISSVFNLHTFGINILALLNDKTCDEKQKEIYDIIAGIDIQKDNGTILYVA